jgi:hypothetical protein
MASQRICVIISESEAQLKSVTLAEVHSGILMLGICGLSIDRAIVLARCTLVYCQRNESYIYMIDHCSPVQSNQP